MMSRLWSPCGWIFKSDVVVGRHLLSPHLHSNIGGVMYAQLPHKFGPWRVVRYFEKCLAEAANPIKFTPASSEGKQLGHARRLLVACKHSEVEVKAIIEEFCRENGYPYRTLGWGEALWKSFKVFRTPKAVQSSL